MKYVHITYNKNISSNAQDYPSMVSPDTTIAKYSYNWPATYKSNDEISNFLNTVTISIEGASENDPNAIPGDTFGSYYKRVKNGDVVTVTAKYDSTIATEDHINIVNGTSKSTASWHRIDKKSACKKV